MRSPSAAAAPRFRRSPQPAILFGADVLELEMRIGCGTTVAAWTAPNGSSTVDQTVITNRFAKIDQPEVRQDLHRLDEKYA